LCHCPASVFIEYFGAELLKNIIYVLTLAVVFSGKIKELLSAELDIPVSEMELHGWIHKNDALIQDAVSV